MPTAEEFDEFYLDSRRRLVHQTFAVTGDLSASRTAVRDAYVAARHHWNKVGRMADPEQWVRPRAWAIAQRRHTARPWHKEKSLLPEQAELLEALHKLSDAQRKTLVLTHLAVEPLTDIGREIGETQEKAEHHLQTATAALALALDGDATAIRSRLQALGDAADTIRLPRPQTVRRNGLRRRRNHAVVGSLVAVLVTVGVGALVLPASSGTRPAPKPGALVSKRMLLADDQVTGLAPKQPWTLTGTSDNTSGEGLNTMCQTARFADPDGLGTWVRTFATNRPERRLVQTVEISSSPAAAKKAFDTTMGWYSGCKVPRIQLVDAYTVQGLGDQAVVMRMRIPSKDPRSFVVGIARSGSLTTSTVLETHTPVPAAPTGLVSALTSSVQNLCESRVAGTCIGAVSTSPTLPPATGEAPGMLAIADLPAVAGVMDAWAGTDAAPATVNIAATTCDRTDFAKAGAVRSMTRTYLIPEAHLPQRFGLTETLGELPSPRAASALVARIGARMKACPDKELGSTVNHAVVKLRSGTPSYAMWRLENQVNQKQQLVPFWMGVVQDGRYVAQVNLTPVGKYDVDQAAFQALVVRARDRLAEVSR